MNIFLSTAGWYGGKAISFNSVEVAHCGRWYYRANACNPPQVHNGLWWSGSVTGPVQMSIAVGENALPGAFLGYVTLQGTGTNPFGPGGTQTTCPTPTPTPTSAPSATPTPVPTLPFCPEGGQGDSAQSAPLCQVVTPTPTPTDPAAVCLSTDTAQLETALNGFGIRTSPVVHPTPTATATPVGDRINWTVTELQQICLSITRIGQAFLAQTSRNVMLQVIFKEVMGVEDNGIRDQGEIELIRVTNRVNCIVDNGTRTITCGNLEDYQGNPRAITEYVITHEFGHVFDNQADRGNGRALRDYVADTGLNPTPTSVGTHVQGPILDGQGNILTGNVANCNNGWLRGERGWGSGPGSIYSTNPNICAPQTPNFTQFQQNTAPYASQGQANEETSADMFLNWVYRKIGLGGFLNRDWRPTVNDANGTPCNQLAAGCDNTSALSGDARFNWTQTIMNQIFSVRAWN